MLNRLVKCVVVVSTLGSLLAGATAQGAALVQYHVTSSASVIAGTPNYIAPTSPAANTVTTNLTTLTGALTINYTSQYSGIPAVDGAIYFDSSAVTSSAAGAVTDNDYVTFTITPSAGYALDLTSLTYTLGARTGTTNGATYTNHAFVRSSDDSFGADLGSIATASVTRVTANASSGAAQNVDLTGLADQSGAISFRVYVYKDATNPAVRVFLDNIVLNGEVVAVPEPATLGMLGIAGSLLLARRRNA